MRQKRSRAWKLLLTVAVLALLLSIVLWSTGVFAALGDTTKLITVQEGSVSCELDRDYTIRNTGTVPVLLRAKIVVNWLDAEGSVLAQPPADAALSIDILSGWEHFPADSGTAAEGYWYYTKVLDPNAKVALIDKLSSEGGTPRVTVLAEAIQSSPKQAVAEAWDMTWTNGSWAKK